MNKRGHRRQLLGIIVSDKMDKSAIVQVERLVKHPLYKKYIRKRSKFAVHDKDNACRIGDQVLITESRPLSRTKKWQVSKVVQKAE